MASDKLKGQPVLSFKAAGPFPLDDRTVFSTYEQLTNPASFTSDGKMEGGIVWALNTYIGMIAAVTTGKEKGIYWLSRQPYDDPEDLLDPKLVLKGWEKITDTISYDDDSIKMDPTPQDTSDGNENELYVAKVSGGNW